MRAQEKAAQLQEIYASWMEQPKSQAQICNLKVMIALLLELIKQLSRLEQQIEETASDLPEVELVKSIPGIGDKLAAKIVAEIGDIRQFSHAKQLVAFAGLDPGIFRSGAHVATRTRITKRGSKRLRRLAVDKIPS